MINFKDIMSDKDIELKPIELDIVKELRIEEIPKDLIYTSFLLTSTQRAIVERAIEALIERIPHTISRDNRRGYCIYTLAKDLIESIKVKHTQKILQESVLQNTK